MMMPPRGMPPPGGGFGRFPRIPLLGGPQLVSPLGIPPGLPSGPEVWLEHKMPNGRTYYSNSITRQTQWEKPKDAVIHPGPPAPTIPTETPSTLTPSPVSAPNTSGPSLVNARVWSEHKREDGKVYYYNKITMTSVWTKPQDFDLVLPMPPALAGDQSTEKAEGDTTEGVSEPQEGGEDTDSKQQEVAEEIKEPKSEGTQPPEEDSSRPPEPVSTEQSNEPTQVCRKIWLMMDLAD